MNSPDLISYDDALARLDRYSATIEEFCALAVDALAQGLGCQWALVVMLPAPGQQPVLLASYTDTARAGTAGPPLTEIPAAPPFRSGHMHRSWFVETDLHQEFGDKYPGLRADVASCHGHILENALGHTFEYVLAMDSRALADDSAAAMFFRLVAERISSVFTQNQLVDERQFLEQRFQDFAEAGADWFWELDADLRIGFVSESFEKATGEPAATHRGRTRQDILGPGYDRAFWDDHLACLAEHRPFHDFINPYRTVDGHEYWFRSSGTPAFDPAGEFIGYRCAGSDVTASVLAKAELENSSENYRKLLDSSPMGVTITKASDGSILFANRQWAQFNGKSVAELLGTDISAYYPEPTMRDELLARVRIEGAVRDEEFQVLSRDRRRIWILLSLYPVEFEGEDAIVAWSQDIDERKRADTDLRASEQRFRDLAEGSIQGMAIVDANWRPLFVNQALAAMFGYDSPEMILAWANLSRLHDKAEADRIRGVMRARFNNEPVPAIYEARGQTKDGDNISLQLMGRFVEWEGRQALQVTVIDITERKVAEDSVRKSEQRFHDFAEASSDWLWETDAEYRFTYVSAGFERSTGIAPDVYLGKDRHPLLVETPNTAADLEMLRKLEAHEPIRDYTQQFQPPGKDPLWIRSSLVPIHDRDNEFIGWRGTTVDITAEVEARQRLQTIADRYLNAIDNISEGIALWDADDKLVICNQRFREFSFDNERKFGPGISFEEATRASAAAGNFEQQDGALEAAIQRRLASHRNSPSEMEVRRRDRTLNIRDQPTPDGGTISIVIDVTQQRQFEAQLHQAQKMEAVGHLTGGIAHDFNNLLAVISGNLELLESRARNYPELSRFIDRGLAAADRGARLTQRLLAFSRKQPLAAQTATLDRLIGDMHDLVRRALGETIQIETSFDDNPWPFLIDTAQLENAILNLAINARDAMPRGGTLTIEAGNLDLTDREAAKRESMDPGLYVALSISDTGEGMSEEVIEHAFEPFFTTKDVDKGSGLGLSMVYAFVQQSEGQVRVESTLGRGTTVKIYLPSDPDAELDDVSMSGHSGTMPGNNQTILVVEDDPEVRDIAVSMLNELGYQVLQTEEGSLAMQMIAETPQLDLLLTDVVLPRGMSGRALAENARITNPALKVLFMSGYARNAFAADGRPDPGDELLEKPFHKADLSKMVRRALDG